MVAPDDPVDHLAQPGDSEKHDSYDQLYGNQVARPTSGRCPAPTVTYVLAAAGEMPLVPATLLKRGPSVPVSVERPMGYGS